MSFRIIAFLTILTLSVAGITSSMCHICERCTFCSGDVLSDCEVYQLYAKIIAQYPQIANAYPITITKTVQYTSTQYFFQFSNNYNVTFSIMNAATSSNNFVINSSQVSNMTVTGGGNAGTSGPVVNKQNMVEVNGSSGGGNGTIGWMAASNAGAVILAFAKSHYYLSSDAGVVQLLQNAEVNVYTVLIASNNSIYQMKVKVDNTSVSVLGIGLVNTGNNKSFNGSSPNGSSANMSSTLLGTKLGAFSLKGQQVNGVNVN